MSSRLPSSRSDPWGRIRWDMSSKPTAQVSCMWTRTRQVRKTARVGPMPMSTSPKPWFLNNLSTKFGWPKGLTCRARSSRLPFFCHQTFRCTVGFPATKQIELNAIRSLIRLFFPETSAPKGWILTIPIMSSFHPRARPSTDSQSKTAMPIKTSATIEVKAQVYGPTPLPSRSETVRSPTTVRINADPVFTSRMPMQLSLTVFFPPTLQARLAKEGLPTSKTQMPPSNLVPSSRIHPVMREGP